MRELFSMQERGVGSDLCEDKNSLRQAGLEAVQLLGAKVANQSGGNVGNVQATNRPKLVSMADVLATKQDWLWDNRIPLGGLTLLEGDPGHGKSTLTDDLVARLTSGKPMPLSKETGPQLLGGAVLLKGEERLDSVVKPRLEASGADLGRIRAISGSDQMRIPRDLDILEQGIDEVDAKLVVIDPLPQFVDDNLNSSVGTQRALGPLAALAEKRNIAILLVRHLGKAASRNSLYRGLGSVSIIGLARSALLVAADPGSDEKHRHMLALNKSNLGSAGAVSYETVKQSSGAISVKWLGTTSHSAEALASGRDSVLECSELERAMDFLYGILIEGDIPQKKLLALALQADVSKRTLYRAKQAMRVASKRVGRTCWVWKLPEGEVEAVAAAKERYVSELCDWLAEQPKACRK